MLLQFSGKDLAFNSPILQLFKPESHSGYTISEFLAQIEPQYRAYKDTMRQCDPHLLRIKLQAVKDVLFGRLTQFRRMAGAFGSG